MTAVKVTLLVGGILSLVLCGVLLVFAYMEYEDNVAKVRAMNQMMHSNPLGGMLQSMTGQADLQPGMPASAKYAILGAVAFGLVGLASTLAGFIWLLASAGRHRPIPSVRAVGPRGPA